MPFVSVKIAGEPASPAQKSALQSGLTELMGRVMRKVPALTAVAIEQIPPADWTVGGAAPVFGRAAHVDVKVTEGTNSPAEMARFVKEAHALLKTTLGELPEATYVVIHEIPAVAWGYGGLTQEARRQQPASI
ncbi:MAG: 4-oxalocrotonate tautomerase [Alphaproteobacteria bacterium]|jgi:4-oxalocrotonate tautomerase|nr:4-oxalocrotonate tautomerase [Alphaproteobacteria bacterium]